MTLEYFMDYSDDPGKPESQTSYFKQSMRNARADFRSEVIDGDGEYKAKD
jgi:hypothetical protein